MPDRDGTVVDWVPPRRPRRRGRLILLVALGIVLLGSGTVLSYYVDALWFESLGYVDVFWKSLNLQGAAYVVFFLITFLAIYGSFLAFKPANFGEGRVGRSVPRPRRPAGRRHTAASTPAGPPSGPSCQSA